MCSLVVFYRVVFHRAVAHNDYFIEGIKVLGDLKSATRTAWAQRMACIELMSTALRGGRG